MGVNIRNPSDMSHTAFLKAIQDFEDTANALRYGKRLPHHFNRIQHGRSKTHYRSDGFELQSHYDMDCHYSLNPWIIRDYLNWQAPMPRYQPPRLRKLLRMPPDMNVSAASSPHIFGFDNEGTKSGMLANATATALKYKTEDARARARFHRTRGDEGVFIAKISTGSLEASTIRICSAQRTVLLPT
jgi:hypothetical protein